MVRFERTLTIILQTETEAELYMEALELAADNGAAIRSPVPSLTMELKTRRAVLACTPPSLAVPTRITLSYEGALAVATALEVMEEITEETRAEQADRAEITPDMAAVLKRCNMLENAARYIREAVRS